MRYKFLFGKGPNSPKASWDYMSKMGKCCMFLHIMTATLQLRTKTILPAPIKACTNCRTGFCSKLTVNKNIIIQISVLLNCHFFLP